MEGDSSVYDGILEKLLSQQRVGSSILSGRASTSP